MNRNNFNYTIGILCLYLLTILAACSEDKGNYVYSEKNIIEITGIPEYNSLLAKAEYIDFKPTIISSLEGVIEADNPNYEFSYQRKASEWVTMGNEKNLYMLAALSEGVHECYFSVTDKRTNVKTIQKFIINATTITSEGWMVLCNEGAEEKLRMDMLAHISTERILPVYNVIEFDPATPELRQATNIGYYRTRNSNIGDDIILLSKTGAYIAPTADIYNENSTQHKYAYGEFITVSEAEELILNKFLARTNDHIVEYASIPIQPTNENLGALGKKCASICISDEGNAYAWFMCASGTGFEYPINTPERGEKPTYRVAPHIGRSLQDCGTAPTFGIALLYDIDNHQFIGWDTEGLTTTDNQGKTQKCYPLTDPESKLFSYNTGNMDLVTMLSTANNGYVYCIMQDGDKRHVYVIQLSSPDKFTQVAAYTNIQAPDFDKATCFAASSQYPILYYAYKNKVYAYNLTTNTGQEIETLASQEEVTMLKFNIYEDVFGGGAYIGNSFLGKLSEELRTIYLDREKQLIVGSYNSTENINGGILRFYNIANGGININLINDTDENGEKRTWEFKGYARIQDVTYKEKQ